jgi:hypothetical protein
MPTSEFPSPDPLLEDPPRGYRPPFAPHGPYVTSPYPYPGLGSPPPPIKRKREPSRLGRFTLSLTVLAVGVLALIQVAGVHMTAAPYFATALATVGLGLLVGAWYGRSRGLIWAGMGLSLLLLVSTVSGNFNDLRTAGDVAWVPNSMGELGTGYLHSFGDANLDLTRLNFDGLDKQVSVQINAGNLTVNVPPKVDVVVHARVNVGNADIFGTHWDGVNNPTRTINDNDSDGPGGGHLTLNLTVKAGNLEVSR